MAMTDTDTDTDEALSDDEVAAQWEASLAEADGDGGEEKAEGGGGDALAKEWEGMAGGDGDADGDAVDEFAEGDTQSARVLNQDEIDSLLGFDGGAADETERSGIRAIVNSALVSYECLPMREVVFDRLVRMMTTSLRNFTSDNVEVSLDNITSIRFGDYLNSIPLPAILGVFRAVEWDNYS